MWLFYSFSFKKKLSSCCKNMNNIFATEKSCLQFITKGIKKKSREENEQSSKILKHKSVGIFNYTFMGRHWPFSPVFCTQLSDKHRKLKLTTCIIPFQIICSQAIVISPLRIYRSVIFPKIKKKCYLDAINLS